MCKPVHVSAKHTDSNTDKLAADIMNTVLDDTENTVYCMFNSFFLHYLPNSCCFLFLPSLLFWDVTKFRGGSRVTRRRQIKPRDFVALSCACQAEHHPATACTCSSNTNSAIYSLVEDPTVSTITFLCTFVL